MTTGAPPDLMRVAACAGDGAVRIEMRPRPRPGRGELALRLRCAGLCGTDLWKLRQGGAPAGAVLGHEVVGTVEAVGEGAVGFAVGDRVVVPHHVACGDCDRCRQGSETMCAAFGENLLAPGGFSEGLVVGERAVRRAAFGLPPRLADESAVFLEPAACVLRGIWRARVAAADPQARGGGPAPARGVAVLGAGSMGLLHLLLLKALRPALEVVIVEPLAWRRELARRLGADAAASPGDEARRAVARLCAGRGVDAVFDTAGGAAALESALSLTRPGGSVVLFAHAGGGHEGGGEEAGSGPVRAGFDLNALFKAEQRLIATYSGSLAEQREVYRLLVTGRFDPRPLVTHRLPLSRLAEAIELARGRKALKVLLVADAASGGGAKGE
jgi:L-iditol 2-dehydrogenase